MFENGVRYTRQEIHNKVGGQIQSYLPTVRGKVVAICLDPVLNPDAPSIALSGFGKIIEKAAASLADSYAAVPTFVKRGNKEWEYVGMYKVNRQNFTEAEVRDLASKANRIGQISSLLYLERISDQVNWSWT